MILQNFNIYLNYNNFLSVEKDISKMVSIHEKKIDFNNKKLISCGTIYPSNKNISDINLVIKPLFECLDETFLVTINNNDLIYFEYNSDNKNIIFDKLDLVYEDEYFIPDRFGKIKAKKNQFFKKKFFINLRFY